MSDFDSLREDLAATLAAVEGNGAAVQRFAESTERETAALWRANAELRDDLHAVANRVEMLTRALGTSPEEVAKAMLQRLAEPPI